MKRGGFTVIHIWQKVKLVNSPYEIELKMYMSRSFFSPKSI